ncbi:MAG: hypothetical protein ABL921_00320, partial [Pirellula sp.]
MATLLEWLKSTVASFFAQESDSERRERELFPRVYDSQLEDRRVLNAGAVISAIDLVAIRFDAGSAANDGAADKFELTRLDSTGAANQIAVSINDQRVWQGFASELQSIRFDGSNDADQFFIDPTIQLPTGIIIDGRAAASGPQALGSGDIVVLATVSEYQFDEVTYQSTDYLTQIRIAFPSQPSSSLIQVHNVETIEDLTLASERTITIGSAGDSYVLRDSNDSLLPSEHPLIQFDSAETRIEFAVPTTCLTIDMQTTTANRNSILVETTSLGGLEQLRVVGSDSDVIRQKGNLTIGRSLTMMAGTINIDGSISSGSSGELRLDAGSGVLTVNGNLSSRGDESHRGGNIVLAGDQVSLLGWTRVDVSGGVGGGQIRVGGGFQGKDASVRN